MSAAGSCRGHIVLQDMDVCDVWGPWAHFWDQNSGSVISALQRAEGINPAFLEFDRVQTTSLLKASPLKFPLRGGTESWFDGKVVKIWMHTSILWTLENFVASRVEESESQASCESTELNTGQVCSLWSLNSRVNFEPAFVSLNFWTCTSCLSCILCKQPRPLSPSRGIFFSTMTLWTGDQSVFLDFTAVTLHERWRPFGSRSCQPIVWTLGPRGPYSDVEGQACAAESSGFHRDIWLNPC